MISVPYEVKKALRDGMLRKNYRFVVLKDDGTEDFTIDNDNLVSESVSIDERMCSGDTIHYGLCEGSSLEFQYFNKPNITGRRVQVFIDVEYDATGTYTKVDEFEEGVENAITEGGHYRVYSNTPNAWAKTILRNGISFVMEITPASTATETYQDLILTSWDSLEVVWGSIDPTTHPVELQKMVEGMQWYTIPLGYFDVKKCSRQASTGIIKATCYNKLQSDYLDQKANQEIIDIVSEGEEGNSTVSFYWILDKLLKDYSIEKYETSTTYLDIDDYVLDDDYGFEVWLWSHNAAIREICFPLYGSSHTYLDKYLHICVFGLAMGGLQGGMPAYYDKFRFNGEVAKNITTSVYRLRNSDLDNNYVRSNSNSADYMSLRDFLINGGWATFWAVSSPQWSLEGQKEFVGGEIRKEDIHLATLQSDYTTGIHYISNDSNVYLVFPYYATITTNTTNVSSSTDFKTYFRPLHHTFGWIYKELELNIPEAAMQRITLEQAEKFGDVTLRDLQSAVYETVCQFGQLSRITDLFSGVELNHSRLYPADTLYPATDLYPDGAALSGFKSMYSQLWADEGNVRKWRYLIITYKGLDGDNNEAEFTLQRTVNADGTDDYNMSDNWLFKNLVWTAADVGDYADAMVAKMQDMTWFPFEMWCAGLPYIETGDEIEIPLNGESYTSYVLQRQLKGIQNLQDTYTNGTLDIF